MTVYRYRAALYLSLCLSLWLTACSDSDSNDPDPVATVTDCAVARSVTRNADLVSGPLARGRAGDIVIENNRLRAIIQKGGRNWFNIGQFGGNIIDAVPKAADGSLAAEDHYEEATLGTNIESSPNYQNVEVINPGGKDSDGNCIPAVVRATGPDDLLDFVNGSSAIRDMDFMFPDSADDVDLPVTIQTDYTLDTDQNAIHIASTLINESDSDVPVYMVEYANGSGEVELFQYGYGFGEALITAPCDSCRSIIYAGHEGGSGVSYGIVHNIPRTSTFSTSGVSVLVYGTDATVLAAAGGDVEPQPFTVPASGEFTLERWFVVGNGTVSSIFDTQYQLLGQATGTLSGSVSDSNGPVAGAEIAIIAANNDFTPIAPGVLPLPYPSIPGARGPATIVANHFRTDATGRFSGQLPPGDYELRLNIPGRGAGTPSTADVTIAEGEITIQNFDAPLPAQLRVLVRDKNNQPVPAKVQLIGTDNSPDAGEPQNSESVLGILDIETGIYGDINADKLPPGVILSEFAVADPNKRGAVTLGDTGILNVQPGEFQLSVSRGPRYSEHVENITLTAGNLTEIEARIVQVVDTSNHVMADFHVHSFDSPDSEVTNRERVITYLAEDMEFFTPSDHGMRVDFEPVIADMQVGQLIASTPSAEVTTFDYGHFNAWPVAIETVPANADETSQSADPKLSRGATDWGGPAPVGEDFPSKGNYSLEPAKIIAEAKSDPRDDGREVVVQINHVESHFGVGLEIDTGVGGPVSNKTPEERRLNSANANPETGMFDENFDSLELWIGVDGADGQTDNFIGQNIGDWFNLLNHGTLKTFVANSDTHDRRQTSLATRNYISVPSVMTDGRADPQKLRTAPHDVGDAVIEGYTTGSNSLFMTVKANDTAGLEQSDTAGTRSRPLNASGDITLDVSITAPTWAEYDEIAIYANAATTRHTDELGQPTTPARYKLCSPTTNKTLGSSDSSGTFTRQVIDVDTLDGKTYQRFGTQTDFTLNIPEDTDTWVVVLARGNREVSKPLWPVVPNDFVDSDDGLQTRSAEDTGVLAMAVSNPIYIDADGDGWQAPGVQVSETCEGGDELPLAL